MAYTSEIEKLERRHQENPKGRTFAILADHYRKAGEIDRAVALLKEGLEIHPDYPSALIVLGRCHLDRNDYQAAEEPFRHVLQIDAENGIALRAMADVAEYTGRPAEARRWLETLLSIDSTNEGAREQLARVSGAPERPAPEEDPILQGGFDIEGSGVAEAEDLEPEPGGLEIEPTSFEGGFASTPAPDWSGGELLRQEPFEAEPEETLSEEDIEATPALETSGLEIEPEEQGLPDLTPPARSDFDIGVERADEIVLRSTGSTEFQVASAAEDLGATLQPAGDEGPIVPEAAEPPREPEAAGEDFAEATEHEAPAFEAEAVSPIGSNWWDPVPGAGDDQAEDDTAADAAIPASDAWDATGRDSREARDETPVPVEAEETGGSWYSAFDTPGEVTEPVEPAGAAGEEAMVLDAPDALPPEAALPSDEPVFVSDGPAGAETPPVDETLPDPAPAFGITETLAEIYVAQGHHHEAILVYRQLLERNPGSERLLEKLAAAEAMGARAGRPDRRSYSAGESGGTSVGGYFAGILAARPSPADVPPPDAARVSEGNDDDSRPAGAAPTRPATDPLSLSAIFGEEGTTQGGAAPSRDEPQVGAPPASPGLRFDEFFDSPPPAGTRPADDDDLSQFHDWLKSLKR